MITSDVIIALMFLQDSLPFSHGLTALFIFRNVLALGCVWITYHLLRAAWNVSPLHPLSRIPGPKLAAATYLPEIWYDVVKFGRYTKQIEAMHKTYGPIIRISPHEVHCNDAQFIDEIYAVGGRKRDKPRHQVSGSAMEHSGFATFDHDLHRNRRIPLAKFFARGQIARLEPQIQELVQRLCDKLLAQTGKIGPIDITMAYSCFTSDTISDYCFGESFGFLAQESWEPNFRGPLYSLLRTVFIFRFFPYLKHTTVASSWLLNYLPEATALLIRTLTTDLPKKIKKTKADIDAGIVRERPTVFGELLNSDLPSSEKSVVRLTDEAASVLGGGTETASWTLSVITYHLLTQPKTLSKLIKELRDVVDNPQRLPPWTTLEKLPYLDAVIHEGLRLSYGVSARTSRVPTEESLIYRGTWMPRSSNKPIAVEHVIPQGFAIGMSAVITHHDESIFPDSHSFMPERWLDENGERSKDLERALLTFSKGSRACLGMNLAFCELYLTVTALALRVYPHMRLFETTEKDVTYDHDMFVPLAKDDSKGVRVIIV
ncbi:cytochrome P450 [Biscogniauxia marginata]|nr:cytochrome P450 [Biscogniauxia marginata]